MRLKNNGGNKNMKCVTVLLLTISAAVCHADTSSGSEISIDPDSEPASPVYSGHSLMLGGSRFRQQLNFEQRDLELVISGRSLQYQYFSGDWILGGSLAQTSGDDTESGKLAYQLEVDGQAVNLFSERTLGQFGSGTTWFGVAVAAGRDEQSYNANRSGGSGKVSVKSRFRSISLDAGYSYPLESSRLSVSGGLTQQWFYDEKNARVSRSDEPTVEQRENSDEQALLAAVSAGFEKFWLLNADTELAAFAGLRYQYTLGGDGRIQQSQLRHGARGVQQRQRNETFNQENDSLAATNLRLSVFYRQLNLTLEVDKVSDESFADAYYTAGVGLSL